MLELLVRIRDLQRDNDPTGGSTDHGADAGGHSSGEEGDAAASLVRVNASIGDDSSIISFNRYDFYTVSCSRYSDLYIPLLRKVNASIWPLTLYYPLV